MPDGAAWAYGLQRAGNVSPALHTSGRNKLHERRPVQLLAGRIPVLACQSMDAGIKCCT